MKRNQAIDALRALACLMVIGHHSHWIPVWSGIGWTGVDLFFVLSGFLISGLLFKEHRTTGRVRIGRFLTRRGLKIYPAYYLFLVYAFFSLRSLGFDYPTAWGHLWHDAVFVQNYLGGSWQHLWSLAVEEHFYLLMPIAIWLAAQRKRADPFAGLAWVCAAVMVISMGLRFLPWSAKHAGASHVRFDGLALGVLLSYLWHYRPELIDRLIAHKGRYLLAASLVLLSPQFFLQNSNPWMFRFGLSSIAVGYGGVLVYFMTCLDGTEPILAALANVGKYSYTIYLVHLPVLLWILGLKPIAATPNPPLWMAWAVFLAYVALSLGIGVVCSKAIEMPVLRLRDRLLPVPAESKPSCWRDASEAAHTPDAARPCENRRAQRHWPCAGCARFRPMQPQWGGGV